jgi:hypothetical protein
MLAANTNHPARASPSARHDTTGHLQQNEAVAAANQVMACMCMCALGHHQHSDHARSELVRGAVSPVPAGRRTIPVRQNLTRAYPSIIDVPRAAPRRWTAGWAPANIPREPVPEAVGVPILQNLYLSRHLVTAFIAFSNILLFQYRLSVSYFNMKRFSSCIRK